MRLLRPLLAVTALLTGLTSCSDDDGGASSAERTDAVDDGTVAPAAAPSAAPTTAAEPSTSPSPTAAPTTEQVIEPALDPLQIATGDGPVRGADSAVAGVRQFLAIPYAAPPVGDDRWRPPRAPDAWTEPLDATAPGAACPQVSDGITASVTVIPAWDEDCLTLSVWAPRDADELPVMVWFHGGGLSGGSAHQPLYTGDVLAARGVVVVNVNYRLGALGFLATDRFTGGDGPIGNLGLADQVAALGWVADNIGTFGGDPGNVTIFGESAGGSSVCAHLATTASAGLFQRGIVQSGGGCDDLQSSADAEAAADQFLAATGCADVACLRALPVEQILAVAFSPQLVADREPLGASAYDAAAAGSPSSIPVLIGSNADEATLFTIGVPEPTDDDLTFQAARSGADPASILALYPPERYATGLARLQAIITDIGFVCPTLRYAAAAAPTWVYHYSYVPPSNPFGLGATHGAELVLLFGHPEGIRGLEPTFDPQTAAVADALREAWVDFATNGDPGWPSYDEGGTIGLFADSFATTDVIRDGRCAEVATLAP